MILADAVNGAFEVLGGLFILNLCRIVWNDKAVAGVSIVSIIFFTGWGVWNLFYYPTLNQWWSFYGGLVVVGEPLPVPRKLDEEGLEAYRCRIQEAMQAATQRAAAMLGERRT